MHYVNFSKLAILWYTNGKVEEVERIQIFLEVFSKIYSDTQTMNYMLICNMSKYFSELCQTYLFQSKQVIRLVFGLFQTLIY